MRMFTFTMPMLAIAVMSLGVPAAGGCILQVDTEWTGPVMGMQVDELFEIASVERILRSDVFCGAADLPSGWGEICHEEYGLSVEVMLDLSFDGFESMAFIAIN